MRIVSISMDKASVGNTGEIIWRLIKLNWLTQWCRLSLIGISLIGIISCQKSVEKRHLSNRNSPASEIKSTSLEKRIYELPNAIVHTLLIPNNSDFEISVRVSDTLETVEDFAKQTQAIAVMNGGFFDPVNGQTTSYIIQAGNIEADPSKNPRLINNPQLKKYLEKILNRSEFRRYQCDQVIKYDITYHQDPVPKSCKLTDAIGGGPKLLPEITAEGEAFLEVMNGQVIRDPLGIKRNNARTAIGITSSGDVIWIMVQQRESSLSGLSLLELQKFLQNLDVQKAINLDGGSSSSLFYAGKMFYGKIGKEGEIIKRPVKSVLVIN